jgi:hypothetical protein
LKGRGLKMKEIDIRDPRSKGRIKRKICNYIKTDDGTELLEFNANFPGFYNSMSKNPTITAFFEV